MFGKAYKRERRIRIYLIINVSYQNIMKFKIYNFLSDDAKIIRKQVFMEEQGFKNEVEAISDVTKQALHDANVTFDDIDNISFHIVMYDENRPVATCRVYEDIVKNEYILGRLSVVKEYRGMSLGAKMIGEAERIVKGKGGTSIRLHAQCRVTPFYGQQGYKEYGVIEDDEGCPHIWMKKQL